MKSQTLKTQLIFIVLISAFMSTCRKDITTPNSETEKLFGKWTWLYSSGGIMGGTESPQTENYTKSIEYTPQGIYITYKDGKRTDKMKFKISADETNASQFSKGIIEYKDNGLFDKNNAPIKQTLFFSGNDTLYLNDQCADCYSHLYVRVK